MAKLLPPLHHQYPELAQVTDGPVQITTSPGVHAAGAALARAAYLQASKKALPHEILLLATSNKGGSELFTAVEGAVDGTTPHIETFHSLCYRLLGRSGGQRPISDHERLMLIKGLRMPLGLKDLPAHELAFELSRARGCEQAPTGALGALLGSYKKELRKRRLKDSDDLLQKACDKLEGQPPLLTYKYIIVSQFEHISALQYKLLLQMRSNNNISIIGDPMQVMPGCEATHQTVFDAFTNDFPAACTLRLAHDNATSGQVVRLTNAIYPESLQVEPAVETSGRVRAVEVLNEFGEAAWVITSIEELIRSQSALGGYTLSDFAVLYRTPKAAKAIRRAFSESGIPFQAVGDDALYSKPTVWAMVEIMRYKAKPSKKREATLKGLVGVKALAGEERARLLGLLDAAWPLSQLGVAIARLFKLEGPDSQLFIDSLKRFSGVTLKAYLQYVDTLVANDFYDATADCVTLATIHSAKNLAFKHVFIIAAEDGTLPYGNTHLQPASDRERRLFYVAVSRATSHVDILHARNRTAKPARESRFIGDLASSVLPKIKDAALDAQQRRLEHRRALRGQDILFSH